MKLSYTHKTDVGIIRDHNEDHYLHCPDLGLFIICDGMGGHAAGEVASQMACDFVFERIKKISNILNEFTLDQNNSLRESIVEHIRKAIEDANSEVYNLGSVDPTKKGMGTTLVMLLIVGNFAFYAHVGDSRLYLLNNNKLSQLTQDHSFVNDLLSAGIITPDQAINHPKANMITRAIGIEATVDVDISSTAIIPSDRFLLCSDGLYEYFTDSEIEEYMIKGIGQIDKMTQVAKDRGGKDNITTIIIDNSCDLMSLLKIHPRYGLKLILSYIKSIFSGVSKPHK